MNKALQPDVEALALLSRSGDRHAFNLLVEQLTRRLLAFACRSVGQRSDAEDIVQTALLKFWEHPDKWQPIHGTFTTWIFKLVINACHDKQRSNQARNRLNLQHIDDALSQTVDEGIDLLLEEKDQIDREQFALIKAIKELPREERDLISLALTPQLSQRQAARIMGITLKAYESRLGRLKRKLKSRVSLILRTSLLTIQLH